MFLLSLLFALLAFTNAFHLNSPITRGKCSFAMADGSYYDTVKVIENPEPRLLGHTVLDPATVPTQHADYGYSAYGHGPELGRYFDGHTVQQTGEELAKFFSNRMELVQQWAQDTGPVSGAILSACVMAVATVVAVRYGTAALNKHYVDQGKGKRFTEK